MNKFYSFEVRNRIYGLRVCIVKPRTTIGFTRSGFTCDAAYERARYSSGSIAWDLSKKFLVSHSLVSSEESRQVLTSLSSFLPWLSCRRVSGKCACVAEMQQQFECEAALDTFIPTFPICWGWRRGPCPCQGYQRARQVRERISCSDKWRVKFAVIHTHLYAGSVAR